MRHLSLEQLHDMLQAAAEQVVVGGTYRHYKGHTYTVTNLAVLEATGEIAVTYRADDDTRISFVRPLDEWLEIVDAQGQRLPRFQLVQPPVV